MGRMRCVCLCLARFSYTFFALLSSSATPQSVAGGTTMSGDQSMPEAKQDVLEANGRSAFVPAYTSSDHHQHDALRAGQLDNEDEEENDTLGDLTSTTIDAGSSVRRESLPSSLSLDSMTAAERREHSRKHSRVHSRNLSVFFPRPGSEAERESDALRAKETFDRARPDIRVGTHFDRSTADTTSADDGTAFYAAPSPSPSSGPSSAGGAALSPSRSRKGHHRKHSVMHDYRGGDDATSTRQVAAQIDVFQSGAVNGRLDNNDERPSTHRHEAHAYATDSSPLVSFLSTPLSHIVRQSSLLPHERPLLWFGVFHFLLGATIWLEGQSNDSLSMAGLGYLVVFDAFGILNSVVADWITTQWQIEKQAGKDGKKSRIGRAYGAHRIETLLQFTQTIYLLFAAIYVCKESVEHALLEGTEQDHEQDDVGLALPRTTLLLSACACMFSNIVLHNHTKLVAACGLSTAISDNNNIGSMSSSSSLRHRHSRRTSVLVDPSTMAGPLLHLFANPFSLTVLFFNVTLVTAALTMPPFQVAALDKVLAGLQSASMLYVAYPASKALGKILLQTAPKQHDVQSVQLMRSLRTIEEHSLVTYVAPPHLWQLTSPTSFGGASTSLKRFSSSSSSTTTTSTLLSGQATGRTTKNAALIASVEVFVEEHATDSDVLDITRWAWQLLAPSVGAGAGLDVGESLRGAVRAGEVIVQVCRESQKIKHRSQTQMHSHCTHDHSHSHTHTHDDHHHDHHDHDHHHH